MTWVKVCGVTTPEAVEAATEAGADAIGLVLAAGSPRRLEIDQARRLAAGAAPLAVLVTVGLPPESLLAAVERVGAGGVQPHGRHAATAAAAAVAAGLFVLRPVAARSVIDLTVPFGQIPLVDTHLPGRDGGTGATFDWSRLPARRGRIVLAGGLGPDNVAEALAAVAPWGVDASSRLESAPGVKDPALIREFVAMVRDA